jgi:hypothetical protein
LKFDHHYDIMRPRTDYSVDAVQEFVTKLFVPNFFSSALSDHCEEMHYAEEAIIEVDDEEDDNDSMVDDEEDSTSVITMKMLTAPLIDTYSARLHVESLLRGFEDEVRKVQPSDLRMLENCLTLPEPATLPTSLRPAEPDFSTMEYQRANCTAGESIVIGESVSSADSVKAELLSLQGQCSQALKNFAAAANLERAEANMRAHEEKIAKLLQSDGIYVPSNFVEASRLGEPPYGCILSQEDAEAAMHAAELRLAALLQSDQATQHEVAEFLCLSTFAACTAEATVSDIADALFGLSASNLEKLAVCAEATQNEATNIASLKNFAACIAEATVSDIADALVGLSASTLEKLAVCAQAESSDELRTMEAEQLIREELHREDHSSNEVDQLIAEELGGVAKTWVAGSPAAAVRQMRRSTTNLLKSGEHAPKMSPKSCSAMYLDLGLVEKSASSSKAAMAIDLGSSWNSIRAQRSAMSLDLDTSARFSKSSSSKKSARECSVGAVQTKTKMAVDALRPLVISKSIGMIPSMSSLKTVKDPWAWDLGPMSGRSKRSR